MAAYSAGESVSVLMAVFMVCLPLSRGAAFAVAFGVAWHTV